MPTITAASPGHRQAEIQAELGAFGFRMEASLSSLDGDDGSGGGGGGHAVMLVGSDEIVDDDQLNKNQRALALATEWSEIENATVRATQSFERQGQP